MASEILLLGLVAGCFYALVAVGYAIVYGALRFVNFAHGEIAIAAAYAYHACAIAGLTPILAATAGVLTSGALAVAIDRLAYRPLRGAPRLAAILCSLGVATILRSTFALLFGTYSINILAGPSRSYVILLGTSLTLAQLLCVLLTPAVLAMVWLVLHRTRLGLSIRAVADDLPMARRSGVRVEGAITAAFALGGLLAGASGLFLAAQQSFNTTTSVQIGIRAFAAAVVGGIGSIHGAAAGGIILGIFDYVSIAIIGAEARDATIFIVLIAILAVRPQGLFRPKELP